MKFMIRIDNSTYINHPVALPSFQSRVHSVHTTLKTPRKKMSANPHAGILYRKDTICAVQYLPPLSCFCLRTLNIVQGVLFRKVKLKSYWRASLMPKNC